MKGRGEMNMSDLIEFMCTVTGFISGFTSSGMMLWYAATLDCGHKWYDASNPYSPILSVIKGAKVHCEECANHARDERWLTELDYSIVHHSRYDLRFGGTYRFYRTDKISPSGFMIVGAVAATPAIDAILRTKTNCGPLSPTEYDG